MTTSRKDLVGPIPLKSDELGDMIGFGSFAAVYKHKKVAAHVIKLSRYGAKVALEKEAAVLEELQHDASGGGSCADYIPRVVSFGYLKVETGGVDVTLPALVMEPRGISVEAKLRVPSQHRGKPYTRSPVCSRKGLPAQRCFSEKYDVQRGKGESVLDRLWSCIEGERKGHGFSRDYYLRASLHLYAVPEQNMVSQKRV
jgi:hypothetical protein